MLHLDKLRNPVTRRTYILKNNNTQDQALHLSERLLPVLIFFILTPVAVIFMTHTCAVSNPWQSLARMETALRYSRKYPRRCPPTILNWRFAYVKCCHATSSLQDFSMIKTFLRMTRDTNHAKINYFYYICNNLEQIHNNIRKTKNFFSIEFFVIKKTRTCGNTQLKMAPRYFKFSIAFQFSIFKKWKAYLHCNFRQKYFLKLYILL